MDTLFFLFTCLLSRLLFLPKTFSQQLFLFLNQIKTLDLLISKRPENMKSYSHVCNILNTLYSMILQFQVAVHVLLRNRRQYIRIFRSVNTSLHVFLFKIFIGTTAIKLKQFLNYKT